MEAQFKFWWHLRSSFGGIKFWWHLRSSFGGIVRSSLVASTQFWWLSSDKFGGQCVCVVSVQLQTQEPPQEVPVVVMSCKLGGQWSEKWVLLDGWY